MGQAKPIPEGFHSITPSLVFRDAARAIAFYVKAFGAQEVMRMAGPNGGIWHAELRFGDSIVFLGDEMPGSTAVAPSPDHPSTSTMNLYVPDVDVTVRRAVEAGAQIKMPVADQFWGDRAGMVVDPFGYPWFVMTHVRDMTAEEMKRAADEARRLMASQAEANAAGADI